jgi:hypothetical protein
MGKKPTSPSWPHRDKEGKRHVDIRGSKQKQHVPVKNNLGATAIGGATRAQDRKAKGRKP